MKKTTNKKLSFILYNSFLSVAFAYNPISTYHYLADPAASSDDEYFYIIADSDDPAPHNAEGYTIKSLYGFKSKDMQNWTDLGIIFEANREMSSVNNIWASGLAVKNGKFYIVFPDGGGGGIGFIQANKLEGPWTNAVNGKEKLIAGWGAGLTNCDGVAWCFDPGIFIDDDGKAYVTWGGGENDSRPNTDNFDIIALNSSMDGISGTATHVQVNNLPTRKMLEASYIHKYKGKYYFSYSTGWQQGAPTIDYAISDNVKGPYTWKGTILEDPNINGKSINGNNNHHGIAEFKGHFYAVYHDRRIAKGHDGLERIPASDGIVTENTPNEGFHRSVSIDEMFYNADGTIQRVKFTNEGPKQIENFNPYETYPALTSSKQKGIRSRTDWIKNQAVTHVLTPLASRKESWIRISGVDFKNGAGEFRVKVASVEEYNQIEIRTDAYNGKLAGSCKITKTDSWQSYQNNICKTDPALLKGVIEQLFLVFKGTKDSTMGILEWEFTQKTSSEEKAPYLSTPQEIPGIIEAEFFDKGELSVSYYDNDYQNKGDANFRIEQGVDIVKADSGLALGYTESGEWTEYSIFVKEESEYIIYARIASAARTNGFDLYINDEKITEPYVIQATGEDWSHYEEIKIGSVFLKQGEQTLKILFNDNYVNVDYLKFEKKTESNFIKHYAFHPKNANDSYKVFNLNGNYLGQVKASEETLLTKAKELLPNSGHFLLESVKTKKIYQIKIQK